MDIETAFADDERPTFYLEILGDAQDQDPFLYEPVLEQDGLPEGARAARGALARTTR